MKKFYILICILLCCGCRARYEIKFNDDKIDDKLSITYSKNEEMFRSFAPDPLYAVDNISYDLKNNDIGDYMNLNYTYSFNTDEYSKAYIPNSCFSNYNFIDEDNKYYFIVDGNFLCRHIAYNYFDSLDIVISTNHIVLDNNADEKKNGKYIWHVNSDDETFSLRFITSHKTINNNSKYYETGIIIFLSFICFVFIIKKIKNKNEL